MTAQPTARIQGKDLTIVHDLFSGKRMAYQSLTPEEAVCSAYALSRSMVAEVTDATRKYKDAMKVSLNSVSCGHFSAFTEEGKERYLARMLIKAQNMARQTGESVVYDYADNFFYKDKADYMADADVKVPAPAM